MSLIDKVAGIVNRVMDTEANEILREIRAEINDGHTRTGRTAASFHIMNRNESALISTGGRGVIESVLIGSNYLPAIWLNDGNGPGRIYPNEAPYLKFKDSRKGGTGKVYRLPSVSSYEGIDYIGTVAKRHR